jgi:hypothetical protein
MPGSVASGTPCTSKAFTVQNCDTDEMTSKRITTRRIQRSQNQYVSQAVHYINSRCSEQQSRYFEPARLLCYRFHVHIFTICHQIVFRDPIRVTKNVNLGGEVCFQAYLNMLSVPCIVGNEFTTVNQQNAQCSSSTAPYTLS